MSLCNLDVLKNEHNRSGVHRNERAPAAPLWPATKNKSRRGGEMWRNRTFQVLISDPGKKCTKVKVSVLRWRFCCNSTLPAPPEPSPGSHNLHLSEGFGVKVKVLPILSKIFEKSGRWRFFRRILVKSSPRWRFWGLSEGFLGRFSPSEGQWRFWVLLKFFKIFTNFPPPPPGGMLYSHSANHQIW